MCPKYKSFDRKKVLNRFFQEYVELKLLNICFYFISFWLRIEQILWKYSSFHWHSKRQKYFEFGTPSVSILHEFHIYLTWYWSVNACHSFISEAKKSQFEFYHRSGVVLAAASCSYTTFKKSLPDPSVKFHTEETG